MEPYPRPFDSLAIHSDFQSHFRVARIRFKGPSANAFGSARLDDSSHTLQPELIVHRMMEFLFAPQVAFSSLYGDMTQQKLDLLQLSACQVAQTRTCPTKIMGSQAQDSSTPSSGLYDMPYCFRSDSISPDHSVLVHPAKDIALGDFGSDGPFINSSLYPRGHRHRPDMATLPDEVGDHPVFFPKLQVLHANAHRFCAAKPAAKKHGKDRTIAFPAQGLRARSSEKCLPLFDSQPVPDPHTQPLGTLDPGDAGGELGTQ
jgi:hypothetical protein